MFRITAQQASNEVLIKLEGRLTGAWVGEAEAGWRAALSSDHGRRVVVDVCDVVSVDEAGRALLTAMHRAGAVFAVRGCAMRELVREIVDESSPVAASTQER